MENTPIEEAAGNWYFDLMQTGEIDPATIWEIHISRGLKGQPAILAGRVVVYEEEPPFVEEIHRNDLLLPHRVAQQLLRRLWESFRWSAQEYDACGACGNFNLKDWLHDHYDDCGKEIMAYINTTFRSFA